ncbi:hypothetical protein TNCV_1147381 [Trichonephila clavipes]|nr:hypothetical protein TNCV_1147381 [Trichonephila clavipes]
MSLHLIQLLIDVPGSGGKKTPNRKVGKLTNRRTRIPKKFGDSCPLDKDDLVEFMTVYDNKEVDNDEVGGEVQLIKFART